MIVFVASSFLLHSLCMSCLDVCNWGLRIDLSNLAKAFGYPLPVLPSIWIDPFGVVLSDLEIVTIILGSFFLSCARRS